MDTRSRITVVGRRRASLSVPATVPIVEYVGELVRLCAGEEDEVLPAAWTLGPAVGPPFPPEATLEAAAVTDGSVLYLRDFVGDEIDEPVVLDIAEQVGGAGDGALERRWSARHRAVTAVALGVVWLVAAGVLPAFGAAGPGAVAGVLACVLAVSLPAAAWAVNEWLPGRVGSVRLMLALASPPLAGSAGRLLAAQGWAQSLTRHQNQHQLATHGGLTGLVVSLGVVAGALLAAVAAPAVATYATLAGCALMLPFAVALAALHAGLAATAGGIGFAAFVLLWAGPAVVGRALAAAVRRSGASTAQLSGAVREATIVLSVWNAALSVVAAVSLVLLAGSGSGYGVGLAAVLALGLAARAGSAATVLNVVPVLCAGITGLFAVLLLAPASSHWPDSGSVPALAAVGLLLAAVGLREVLRPRARPQARPGWLSTASVILGAAALPLVLGLFGLYGHVAGLGSRL